MVPSHGMMTRDADGRMEPCAFANPDNVLRGVPDEKAFVHLTSADGNTMIGVWDCAAYAERLIDYPYNEMCTVIEGTVEITADGGRMVTYRAGDTLTRICPPCAAIRLSKARTAAPDPPLMIGAPAASTAKAITLPIWPE